MQAWGDKATLLVPPPLWWLQAGMQEPVLVKHILVKIRYHRGIFFHLSISPFDMDRRIVSWESPYLAAGVALSLHARLWDHHHLSAL